MKRNVVYITWHLEGIGFNPLLPPFGEGILFDRDEPPVRAFGFSV